MEKKGFTVVELIIVLAVVGVLAAILIVAVNGIINKANAASALSDAKNAMTNCNAFMQTNGISGDIVYVVRKRADLYLYGTIGDVGVLFESTGNRYKYDENTEFVQAADNLLNTCVTDGTVSQTGNVMKMSSVLSDVPENVEVYSGFSLCAFYADLLLENSSVELAVGESERLRTVVSPSMPCVFTSDNEAVATVDAEGNITGVAEGNAAISARCGETVVTAYVNVIEFIEFYGSQEQLKQYFEQTGTTTLYLRLMQNTQLSNLDQLPITVPNGKTVRLDLNGNNLGVWELDNAAGSFGTEHMSVLANAGGRFTIENATETRCGVGIANGQDFDFERIDIVSVVVNIAGELNIKGNLWVINGTPPWVVDPNGGPNPELCHEIYSVTNYATCNISYSSSDDSIVNYWNPFDVQDNNYPDSWLPIYGACPLLYNAVGAYATIQNLKIGVAPIVNHGVIGYIKNIVLEWSEAVQWHFGEGVQIARGAIDNYGSILSISGCIIRDITLLTTPAMQDARYRGSCLYSSGSINEISDSEFIVSNYGIPCVFESGSVGSIKNCKFSSVTEDNFEFGTDAVLVHKLTDGEYTVSPDPSLVEVGYIVQERNGKYYIAKQ